MIELLKELIKTAKMQRRTYNVYGYRGTHDLSIKKYKRMLGEIRKHSNENV